MAISAVSFPTAQSRPTRKELDDLNNGLVGTRRHGPEGSQFWRSHSDLLWHEQQMEERSGLRERRSSSRRSLSSSSRSTEFIYPDTLQQRVTAEDCPVCQLLLPKNFRQGSVRGWTAFPLPSLLFCSPERSRMLSSFISQGAGYLSLIVSRLVF